MLIATKETSFSRMFREFYLDLTKKEAANKFKNCIRENLPKTIFSNNRLKIIGF